VSTASVSDISIELNITGPSEGLVDTYRIKYYHTGGDQEVNVTYAGNVTTTTLTPLTPGMDYSIDVWSCSRGVCSITPTTASNTTCEL
jgi:hypothetical protein